MIIVIQCAASKYGSAGYLKTGGGEPVLFVSDPQAAPANRGLVYARPDDLSDRGVTWRQLLLKYNEDAENNPLGLKQAYQLYVNDAYKCLTQSFGLENVFILSAGWGLIRASFLTPQYDITFSSSAESYKRRTRGQCYDDICMLPESADDVVFLGGKDYLPLFLRLTRSVRGRRTVMYNSGTIPDAPGCNVERFATTMRTNWHYACADALIEGQLKPQNTKPRDQALPASLLENGMVD